MPKISVIIPVYNAEKYLEKCIDSVLLQTFTDFECILIDDGSPDNSGKICDGYAKKDERIKVVHQENGGVSCARNAGLDIAQGEWITFIDSDDWVDENYLELMYNNAINKTCDLSICGLRSIDKNGKLIIESKQYPVMFFDKVSAKKILFGFEYFTTATVSKLVNRKYIYENNIRFDMEVKVCEDGLFWFEIIDKIDRVLYDSTPCYNYMRNENSALNSTMAVDKYMTNYIATRKMAQIEKNRSVLRKIKSYEALVAHYLCDILLQRDIFIKEKYKFYRKHLLNSLFYYLLDRDIGKRDKIMAVLYLFPKVYTTLKKIKQKITAGKMK
ncbi:MAG: glycosyltransferase [Chitinivibrionia bacterium]|nr:glycosyltransferase [Chitinivibrionia bacterium]